MDAVVEQLWPLVTIYPPPLCCSPAEHRGYFVTNIYFRIVLSEEFRGVAQDNHEYSEYLCRAQRSHAIISENTFDAEVRCQNNRDGKGRPEHDEILLKTQDNGHRDTGVLVYWVFQLKRREGKPGNCTIADCASWQLVCKKERANSER